MNEWGLCLENENIWTRTHHLLQSGGVGGAQKKRLYVCWTLSKKKEKEKTNFEGESEITKSTTLDIRCSDSGAPGVGGVEPAVTEETRVWRQGDEEFKQNEACRLAALPSVTGVISGGSLSLCLLPLFIWAEGTKSWRPQPPNQIKEVMFIYPPIHFLTGVKSAIAF